MNTSGIFITTDHLKSLPKHKQDFLFGIISGREATLDTSAEPQSAASGSDDDEEEDEHFAELSPGQARDFYAGCGPKTRKAIEVIADGASHQFQIADIAKALDVKPNELTGVWGGLTRRLKTVTGDSDAYLIDWTKSEPVLDDEENYIDHRGEVTELTYRSFRKALGRR
jgi:hypothetical protein